MFGMFTFASVPPNVIWNPKSLMAPAPPQAAIVADAPAGQPGMELGTASVVVATVPDVPVVLVIDRSPALTAVSVPVNVTVNPALVRPPTVTVAPAGQPGMDWIAVATLFAV